MLVQFPPLLHVIITKMQISNGFAIRLNGLGDRSNGFGVRSNGFGDRSNGFVVCSNGFGVRLSGSLNPFERFN